MHLLANFYHHKVTALGVESISNWSPRKSGIKKTQREKKIFSKIKQKF